MVFLNFMAWFPMKCGINMMAFVKLKASRTHRNLNTGQIILYTMRKKGKMLKLSIIEKNPSKKNFSKLLQINVEKYLTQKF